MSFGLPSLASLCQRCGCSETSCASCKAQNNCSDCSGCCCADAHQSWRQSRIATAVRVEFFSSVWMLVEVVGSIVVGLKAGSFALLAFGGDSLIELISGIAVLRFLRKNRSDVESRRSEQVTGALLFALIPVIGVGAAYSYAAGLRAEGSPIGIAIAIGAVIIMPYLWYEKRRIGKETRSLPLEIDAVESSTCLFMSIALLVGLLAVFLFDWWGVDYLATGVILAFVTKEAIETYHELRGKQ